MIPLRCSAPLDASASERVGGSSAIAQASLLAMLSAALFAPGIFAGQLPVFRDLLVLALPLRHYAAEALRAGELPLWSPEIFLGAPFLANYQSGVLYPPSLIFCLAPLPASISLYLAFHVFVAALGTARYLEVAVGLRSAAALLGGVVFGFGGFIFSLVSLINQLSVAVWLPWVLLVSHRLGRERRFRDVVALTILLSLQLLGGAPEAALLTWILALATVARNGLERGTAAGVAGIAIAFVLAIFLSAPQLLATLEYFRYSDRAVGLPIAEVTAESLEPESFLQLVIPHSFEGGAPGLMPERGVPLFWSLYLGVTPLVLLISALASRPPVFWLLVGGGATLLALGSHSPLFPALHSMAPGIFGAFRYPAKFFLPAHFSLALLGAVGLARTVDTRRARLVAITACGALAALGALLAVLGEYDPEALLRHLGFDLREHLAHETYAAIAAQVSAKAIRLVGFAVVTGSLMWLFEKRRLGAPVFAFLLIVSSSVDMFSLHQPSLVFTDFDALNRSTELAGTAITPGQRVFHCLPEAAGGFGPWYGTIRIGENVEARARYLWAALIPDLPILHRIGAVAGIDGFAIPERRDFYGALAILPRTEGVRMLAALGIDWLVGSVALTAAGLGPATVTADAGLWVYRIPGVAPRTYLAERAFFDPDPVRGLVRLSTPEFRAGRDAVLIGDPAEPPRKFGNGTIQDVSFTASRIRANIALESSGLWVVSDSFFPGWRAEVDGEPADIIRVNGIVRGVPVPAGQHEVELVYRPQSFQSGLMLSAAALLAMAGAIAVTSFRRRKGAA